MTPQLLVIGLSLIALLIEANQHGKPRGPHNFWIHCISVIISYSLLIWGGFFDGLL